MLISYVFIPVWGSEVSPCSLLSFLKCVVLFKTHCIWVSFLCVWTAKDSLFMYIYCHVCCSACTSFMSHVFALCKPWWLVSLLLKHLKIVLNGWYFFLLKLFTFQFCVISKWCAISLLQSILHTALYDKKHLQMILA